jgi:subtilisin-like proprotein convertase family protein
MNSQKVTVGGEKHMLHAVVAALFALAGSSFGTATLLTTPYAIPLTIFITAAMFTMSIASFVNFYFEVRHDIVVKLVEPASKQSV